MPVLVLTTCKSEDAVTVVVADAVLLPATGSVTPLTAIVAELINVPPTCG